MSTNTDISKMSSKANIEKNITRYNEVAGELYSVMADMCTNERLLNDSERQACQERADAFKKYMNEQEASLTENALNHAERNFKRGLVSDNLLASHERVSQSLDDEMNDMFNQNYDEVQRLNSEISTKDRIIFANQQAYIQKENTIYVLKNVTILILLMMIFIIAHIKGKLRIHSTIIWLIVLLVIDIIIVWRHFHLRQYQNMVHSVKNKVVGDQQYQKQQHHDKCLTRCRTRDNTDIYDYRVQQPGLKTMDSQNVWKDGNEPWYPEPSESNKPVTYTCKWIGDPDAVEHTVIKTERPCKYIIGYDEITKSTD